MQSSSQTVNGHTGADRQTRSRGRGSVDAREPSAEDHSERDHHDDSAALMLEQRQHESNGRRLHSKRVRMPEPSTSTQIHGDSDVQLASTRQEVHNTQQPAARPRRSTRAHDHAASQAARAQEEADAQMASEWQEAYDNEEPTPRPRRSARAVSQVAKQQDDSDEAAGPSQLGVQLSPVSTREARAQHRSLRGGQEYMPDASPEPAVPDADHVMRRSQRQHARTASASVGVDPRPVHEGSTGIKVTLRPPSGAGRQAHGRQMDHVSDPPLSDADNGRRSGLRVSLRPRRS